MPGVSSGHTQGGHAKTSFWNSSSAGNFPTRSQVREENLRHLALSRVGDIKRKVGTGTFFISLPWEHISSFLSLLCPRPEALEVQSLDQQH